MRVFGLQKNGSLSYSQDFYGLKSVLMMGLVMRNISVDVLISPFGVIDKLEMKLIQVKTTIAKEEEEIFTRFLTTNLVASSRRCYSKPLKPLIP